MEDIVMVTIPAHRMGIVATLAAAAGMGFRFGSLAVAIAFGLISAYITFFSITEMICEQINRSFPPPPPKA